MTGLEFAVLGWTLELSRAAFRSTISANIERNFGGIAAFNCGTSKKKVERV